MIMSRRDALSGLAVAGVASAQCVQSNFEPRRNGRISLSELVQKSKGDHTAAIDALNLWVAKSLQKVAPELGSTFGYVQSGIVVDLSGIFTFSNSLVIYPGIDYFFPAGSTLKAVVDGQTVVRTASKSELSSVGRIYGSSAISFRGGGTIDGAQKASVGFLVDTITDNSQLEFNVIRCTQRRYQTKCKGAAGDTRIRMLGTADVRPLDTVQIPGSYDEFYSIVAIDKPFVILGRKLGVDLDGAPLIHRACGLSANDAQISTFVVQATYNDVGLVFGQNSEAISCTNLRVTGKCEWNMIGELIIAGDVTHRDVTLMHNFDRELVCISGIGSVFDGLYIETMADAQANALMPPVGAKPVGSVNLRGRPLIEILGGRSTFRDVNWPTNPTTTGNRIMMRSRGDTQVENVIGATVPLGQNNVPLPSMFEQAPGGKLRVINVRGWTNLGSQKLILVKPFVR